MTLALVCDPFLGPPQPSNDVCQPGRATGILRTGLGGPLLCAEPKFGCTLPLSTLVVEGTVLALQTCVPGSAMRPTS